MPSKPTRSYISPTENRARIVPSQRTVSINSNYGRYKSKSINKLLLLGNKTLISLFKWLAGKNPRGKVLNTSNLKRKFAEALQKADIKDCTLHDLRHTFASHLAMKGIDLYTISQLLGHADIKMTQRYAHLAPNHKKIAVNMLHLANDSKEKQEKELKFDYSTN